MHNLEVIEYHLRMLPIVARVTSSISACASLLVIVHWICSRSSEKPVNRLIFLATLGNMVSNVATFVSRAALVDSNGPLCQVQAFLIQWFMPADANWTLAMALNVHFTFTHNWTSEDIRTMEPWYILLCYGIPYIPAWAFLYTHNLEQGRMYGNATSWCWVSPKWGEWRIYAFYAPVWIIIVVVTILYIISGKRIFNSWRELHDLAKAVEDQGISVGSLDSVKSIRVQMTREVNEIQVAGLAEENAVRRYSITITSSELHLPSVADAISSTVTSTAVPHSAMSACPKCSNAAKAAAWSYARVAILYFIAMMVTWVPSSANRLYTLLHPGEVNLGLEYTSVIVLPMQGFWNGLIYVYTNRGEVKTGWRFMKGGRLKSWSVDMLGMIAGWVSGFLGLFDVDDRGLGNRSKGKKNMGLNEGVISRRLSSKGGVRVAVSGGESLLELREMVGSDWV
ncbi:hypothetical protein ACMFMG_010311 [Clarireedia jacksonii]